MKRVFCAAFLKNYIPPPYLKNTVLGAERFEKFKIKIDPGNQEIYRPGIAISHASNLCTGVGGDQNKEFRGNASFLREKGPRGGIRILLLYFPY